MLTSQLHLLARRPTARARTAYFSALEKGEVERSGATVLPGRGKLIFFSEVLWS